MNDWHLIAEQFKAMPDATLIFQKSGDNPPDMRIQSWTHYGQWVALFSRAGKLLGGDEYDPADRWKSHLAETCADMAINHRVLYPCTNTYDDGTVSAPFSIVSWV